jgi:hypothetical protein
VSNGDDLAGGERPMNELVALDLLEVVAVSLR